jgi:hypothetical protein
VSHERDHDHRPPETLPPRDEPPPGSKQKPDRPHSEHPTVVPREPIDPRTHPSRRLAARLRLRPA